MIGFLGILLGIILIIYLSVRNVSILIAAPLSTMVICIFNKQSIIDIFLNIKSNSFLFFLTDYILKYFWIFMLGSLLARFMEESGATQTIANAIIKKFGSTNKYNILLSIFVISFILTYGGISLFVAMFAIVPLARLLFKEADISWHLIQIPLWLGICTGTMTVLPGSPAIQNIVPISYLGTSLTAAAIPSVIAAVVCFGSGLLYMKYALEKSIKKNQGYLTFISKDSDVQTVTQYIKGPGFYQSILPLVIMIVLSILGSLFGNPFLKKNIIYISLCVANLMCLILYRSKMHNIASIVSKGASGSVLPIFSTSAAVAFGSVAVGTHGFEVIQNFLFSLPISPYASIGLLTAVLAGITGSSSGSLGIVMPHFASYYLHLGLNPEYIHRIAAIGSNIMTIVPHSGVFLTFLGLTKLSPKNGFKESFIVVAGPCLLAEIVVLLFALL